MEIEIKKEQTITIIILNGELQRQTAPNIQEELLPLVSPDCKLLLDMSSVSYISSAGLRLLLLIYRQIEDQNGRIVLTNLQDMVKDTMSITGFLEFFAAYDTIEDGIAALNK